MGYVSLNYYLMILLAVFLYYILPQKIRWIVLLLASCYFYYSVTGGDMQVLAVFAGTVAMSFLAGIVIEKMHSENRSPLLRKIVLAVGILVSALPLLLSKAGDFLCSSVLHRSLINWIVPVGLSFYSMQVIAYLADIYRGEIKAQKNILKYGLFISFFPLIIQGPISRYSQLGGVITEGHSFDNRKFMGGIQLIIWGFFLKYLIADKASIIVNTVFYNYQYYFGWYVFIAAVLYSIQLYTDFLSCVTISQGVAQLFGIELADNFYHPYFSTSIKDFWRRWHMSLSSWLRDYIYIPLGGNRKGICRKYVNLIITFAVSGLWHGGRWKFLFWGLMHAGYQIAGEILDKPKNRVLESMALYKGTKIRKFVDTIVTSFLVMLAWIIFRAESLKAGIKMICSMVTVINPWVLFDDSLFRLGLSQKEFEVLFLAILVLVMVSRLQEKGIRIREWFAKQNLMIRWSVYLCAIWSIWIFGTYGFGFDAEDFIYGGF